MVSLRFLKTSLKLSLVSFFDKPFLFSAVYSPQQTKIIMGKIAKKYELEVSDIDRIVEMAWEDRTPFDAIEAQFGVPEKDVIKLMRQEMKLSSWKMWRERVQGRSTKHAKKRVDDVNRFKCSRQKSISHNKVSKR